MQHNQCVRRFPPWLRAMLRRLAASLRPPPLVSPTRSWCRCAAPPRPECRGCTLTAFSSCAQRCRGFTAGGGKACRCRGCAASGAYVPRGTISHGRASRVLKDLQRAHAEEHRAAQVHGRRRGAAAGAALRPTNRSVRAVLVCGACSVPRVCECRAVLTLTLTLALT